LRVVARSLAVAGQVNPLHCNGHQTKLGAEDEGFQFGGFGVFHFHVYRLPREHHECNNYFRAIAFFLKQEACQGDNAISSMVTISGMVGIVPASTSSKKRANPKRLISKGLQARGDRAFVSRLFLVTYLSGFC
jgi:hypothetical protein